MRNKMINDLLVSIYYNVLEAELRVTDTEEYDDISRNDMHILQAVGAEEPKKMSAIAEYLHVAASTLTGNINPLLRKGYVKKVKNPSDNRVTWIVLTEKGNEALEYYKGLIHEGIKDMTGNLDEDEMLALIHGLIKMDDYLKKKNTEGKKYAAVSEIGKL